MVQNHRNKMMVAAAQKTLAELIAANTVAGRHGVYGVRVHVRDGVIMEIEEDTNSRHRPKSEELCGKES